MRKETIFAILSLVSGGTPFPEDYERTLLEVCRYTAAYFFRELKRLQFMPDIDNSSVNENEAIGWPSWLPRCWKGVIGPGQIDFCSSDSVQLQTTFMDLDTSAIVFLSKLSSFLAQRPARAALNPRKMRLRRPRQRYLELGRWFGSTKVYGG